MCFCKNEWIWSSLEEKFQDVCATATAMQTGMAAVTVGYQGVNGNVLQMRQCDLHSIRTGFPVIFPSQYVIR